MGIYTNFVTLIADKVQTDLVG